MLTGDPIKLLYTVNLAKSLCIVTAIGICASSRKRAEMTNQQGTGQHQGSGSSPPVSKMVLVCLVSFMIWSCPLVFNVSISIASRFGMGGLDFVKYYEILIIVQLYFNIIGSSLDFYLMLFTRPEFRSQIKTNLVAMKTRILG